MGIVVTIISAAAVLGCFVNPVAGTSVYVAMNIIRPNEHFQGVLFPVIPAMIIAMALSYFVHQGRTLPALAKADRPRSVPLLLGMLALLLVHLLILRRELLSEWLLGELAPTLLLTIFVVRHMGTVPRAEAYAASLMTGATIVPLQALCVHFFARGEQVTAFDKNGDPYISYGKLFDDFHLAKTGRLQGRVRGTFGNSNDLGMVCNWAIPFGIYYLRRKGSKLLKLLGLAVMLICGTTLFLTGSRGGLMQLGITLWTVLVGSRRKVLGVILLVAAVGGVMFVLPRLAPDRGDASDSSGERMHLAKNGLQLFAWRPITGVGFRNFPEFAFKSSVPHNVYIQCLAETGLIGSALFFPLIFFLRREGLRAKKYFSRGADENSALLAASAAGLQFGFMIFSLFSNQFMRFTFALVMMPALSLYLAMVQSGAGASTEEAGTPGDGATPAADGEHSPKDARGSGPTSKGHLPPPKRGARALARRGLLAREAEPQRGPLTRITESAAEALDAQSDGDRPAQLVPARSTKSSADDDDGDGGSPR